MAQQSSVKTKCKKPQELGTPVTLLKDGDFLWRLGLPCHPTTIDMHRIRKTQRGKVFFTSGMSQEMVKSRLQECFPYLEGKTFFCAAVEKVTKDSKRFQLHGPKPSLWNGETIKKNIRGYSSLYVLEYKMLPEVRSEFSTQLGESQQGRQTNNVEPYLQNHVSATSTSVERHVSEGLLVNDYTNHVLSNQLGEFNSWPSSVEDNTNITVSVHDDQLQGSDRNRERIPDLWTLMFQDSQSFQESESTMEVDENQVQEGPQTGCVPLGSQNSIASVSMESFHQLPSHFDDGNDPVSNQHLRFKPMPPSSTNKTSSVTDAIPHGQVEMLPEFLSESPKQLDESQQGLYDKTNNVEPDLQNRVSAATSTSVESYDSCVSSNQHGRFNLLPPFLEDSTNFPVAVQDDQLEISDCTGSSDIFPTSGISEDDLDWSGEDCQRINMQPGNAEFKVSLTPRKVPLQGGRLCEFEFDPKLPTGVLPVCAEFEDLGSITLKKLEDDSMIGRNIPPSPWPGLVTVILKSQYGIQLGKTEILYVDEEEEFLKRVVQEPNLQKRVFRKLADHSGGSSESNGSEVKTFGSLGSTQALQVLKLLVYTAAETGAQPFIEMIFTSSAGRVVFGAYKDCSLLPEVIARRCGHDETALYLEEVTTRFSEENEYCPGGCQTIDWSELIAAVKTTNQQLSHDDKTIKLEAELTSDRDYFGDVEASSSDSASPSRSDSEDDIPEMSLKEAKKEPGRCLDDTREKPVHAPGYQSGRINLVFARKDEFFVENYLLQLKEARNLQEVACLHRPAVSLLGIIYNKRIPRHLNTADEKWCSPLSLQERITHYASISFRELQLNPTIMVESTLVKDNHDSKLSIVESQQPHHNSRDREFKSLYNWLVAGDGFPSPTDGDQPVGWEPPDYCTKQCNSTASEFWVLTCVLQPTRKILFVCVADRRDALPPESWFEDEDCEILIQCWKSQRRGKNHLEFTESLKLIKHPSGSQKSELELASRDPRFAYVFRDEKQVTQNNRSNCPGWVSAVMYHCRTHLPAEEPLVIAIFDNVSRGFMSSWIKAPELTNDGKAKRPALIICNPDDTGDTANNLQKLGYEETVVTSLDGVRGSYRKPQEMHSEKFRPELLDALPSDNQAPHSTDTINTSSSTSEDFWEHHPNDAKITSLTTLHLTVNSALSGDDWALRLADGLAKSRSLTTLHLTVNSAMSGDDWALRLADGLAKSRSLTTLHLTVNSAMSGHFSPVGLADGLAKSRSLTTLHLTLNGAMSGFFSADELADCLAKSTSLTTLHLTINIAMSGHFWADGLADGLAKSTSLTTLHLTLNGSMSGFFSAVGLADCLAKSTSLTTLHLTINSAMSGYYWADGLAHGLAKSTSLTTLHLTVNSALSGYFWAVRLADGLAKSTLLTTLHLTVNSAMSGDDWAVGLADGLAKSTSLTTLHLTVNRAMSGDDWAVGLADGLAKSTSLTTLHLTVKEGGSTFFIHTLGKPFSLRCLTVNNRDALKGTVNSNDAFNSLKSTLTTTPTESEPGLVGSIPAIA